MELTGYIVDYSTGASLPGATVLVTDATAKPQYAQTIANNNGYFKINGGYNNFLLITHVGYSPLLVSWDDAIDMGTFGMDRSAQELPPVTVTPGKTNIWPLIIIIALALLLATKKKRKKKVGVALPIAAAAGEAWKDKTTRIVILGIVVIVSLKVIGLFDRLLIMLGLKKNPDTEKLDKEAEDPDSFWNPNFYKAGPAGTLLLKVATADDLAKQIYDAIGLFDDDEEAVIAVFKSLRTQSQASFLAERFSLIYHADLLTWLRGSGYWPKDRLSDADVKQITDYVTKLPKYIP